MIAKNLIISLRVSLFTILITGIFYPLLVMTVGYLFFYKHATGSLIFNERRHIIGSELVGQNFKNPGYFFSRPSNAGNGYDALSSGGSNLAITSKKFMDKVQERIQSLKTFNEKPIPLDLVTTSASGLDPHISPQAAYWQAPKIALYRNVALKRIMSIIDDQIQSPRLYVLGVPRVNVLKLNLALDQFLGPPVEKK